MTSTSTARNAGLDPADPAIVRSAAVYSALGDPVRLAIAHHLRTSDRTPGDLATALDLTTPLVAHHLATLEAAGVIERRASSGDRRRRYVRLRPEAYAVATPHLMAPHGVDTPDVVFVCTHNAARSQLATALWARRTGGRSRSAGTEPAERVHPGAVAAADRIGIDLGSARPQQLGAVGDAEFVVTVCDHAHETLDHPRERWHWSLPDPALIGSDDAFDDVVRQLDHRIAAVTGSKGLA